MKKGIIAAGFTVIGIISGATIMRKALCSKISEIERFSDKHLALFLLMNQWVKVKQDKKSIAEYLAGKGYKQVAIYGMNYVGETLMLELASSGIEVKYGIDRNADSIDLDIDIVSPEDYLEDVDVIIVTAITFFDEIEEQLNKKVNSQILSLEDILYEI